MPHPVTAGEGAIEGGEAIPAADRPGPGAGIAPPAPSATAGTSSGPTTRSKTASGATDAAACASRITKSKVSPTETAVLLPSQPETGLLRARGLHRLVLVRPREARRLPRARFRYATASSSPDAAATFLAVDTTSPVTSGRNGAATSANASPADGRGFDVRNGVLRDGEYVGDCHDVNEQMQQSTREGTHATTTSAVAGASSEEAESCDGRGAEASVLLRQRQRWRVRRPPLQLVCGGIWGGGGIERGGVPPGLSSAVAAAATTAATTAASSPAHLSRRSGGGEARRQHGGVLQAHLAASAAAATTAAPLPALPWRCGGGEARGRRGNLPR